MTLTLPQHIPGLIDVVRDRALDDPDSTWCRFLADGRTETATVTRRELDDRCRRIALMLGEYVRRGDRVLVMCEPGIDYIAAFLGCLYAGVVAVPAYPPSPLVLERSLVRLDAVVRDAEPAYALTSRLLSPLLEGAQVLRRRDGSVLRQLCIDDATANPDAWHDGDPGYGDDIAFLQYTSGSTGDPKGVVIRHENLLANLAMMSTTFGMGSETSSVSWLPPYHDMGLVGLILWPLAHGRDLTLMPPEAFLKRPHAWPAAMSTYGANFTSSPDFGYKLAARRTTDEVAATMDLRSLDVAVNGAEPVSASTLHAFTNRFAVAGFRARSLWPAYGMAEATLLISSGRWGEKAMTEPVDATALGAGRVVASEGGSGSATTLTSAGSVVEGGAVRIVDPGGSDVLPDGNVGEIVVEGPHVTSGYWQRGVGEKPVVGGLRTGDLGALVEGQLFVTGRIKDMIIIRGYNHYAHDLEATAENAHPGIRPGCLAAFGIEHDGEKVVLVAEVAEGEQQNEVADAVTAQISAVHGIRPHDVVLLPPRTIPKTSSGKIQRAATRAAYLGGSLVPLASAFALSQPA